MSCFMPSHSDQEPTSYAIAQPCRQAAALFLIAPMSAVSMAPPAPPAIACEMMPPTLRLPDCAAATIDGNNNVTTWPSTPPPTRPETMLPIVPRSKVGDDLPAPTPPSAPATRLIRICSMSISYHWRQTKFDLAWTNAAHEFDRCPAGSKPGSSMSSLHDPFGKLKRTSPDHRMQPSSSA